MKPKDMMEKVSTGRRGSSEDLNKASLELLEKSKLGKEAVVQ